MDIQSVYQETILFAAEKHTALQQTIPGTNLPYVIHLSNVAMEILTAAHFSPHFDTAFAVQVALLHDILEDTQTSAQELQSRFGEGVTAAVQALTKNDQLPKAQKMEDSLHRIQQQPKEVWAVKLADRITNLQRPPAHWSTEKKQAYLHEADSILQALAGANTYLENRLRKKMEEYQQYI
ncbi:guanosine-3',5'-bis(diphosphate) 3'-pyrophosphohydrolase [Chitinophaga dinghuensis]|uniref:Guanosine-3',5'-bis(Diphosphate) 3'-pyrophosphohydrolase n=1 Tax=Chitinophaga dinghuensis TaxID=1539050 RepID=A0A327VS15_9BACT|nr:HD domain-containing protein [Chitinophaga dinghuensis]RAJ76748.1 guanosine-3',5'-bis(diphosphate) 3'-pyrophosphohydrolase [Chitinophaga dinghuensis]